MIRSLRTGKLVPKKENVPFFVARPVPGKVQLRGKHLWIVWHTRSIIDSNP